MNRRKGDVGAESGNRKQQTGDGKEIKNEKFKIQN